MTGAFESRETRDFARETKFLIDARQVDDVRAWAREALGRDPHGTGPHGPATLLGKRGRNEKKYGDQSSERSDHR